MLTLGPVFPCMFRRSSISGTYFLHTVLSRGFTNIPVENVNLRLFVLASQN